MNSVNLVGRLTADPEIRMFGSGGKVASFSLAVNGKKKNQQTGQWEDDPMFIDVAVFNRGEHGTLANVVEQYLRKGNQVGVCGKLVLERWQDKATGLNRQKHKIIADAIHLLGSKNDNQGQQERQQQAPASEQQDSEQQASEQPAESSSPGEEIPFSFFIPWWIGIAAMMFA